MSEDTAVARANAIRNQARDDPDAVSQADVDELAEILRSGSQEARVEAAGAFDRLYVRPELLEPVLSDLIEASASYPADVDGIPAPAEWHGDEAVREVVFVADAVARVAQRQPELLAPHADRLADVVRGDAEYPKYHLFSLGMVGAVEPDAVPLETVKSRLCALLDSGNGNGYPAWAAETLGRIGDPDVLPALREHAPDEPSDVDDGAEYEAFREAIEELEAKSEA